MKVSGSDKHTSLLRCTGVRRFVEQAPDFNLALKSFNLKKDVLDVKFHFEKLPSIKPVT